MMKVPLVIYKDGKRTQIGEAVVHDSGAIEGMITEEVTLDGALKAGMAFGASLGAPLAECLSDYKE